jgi:hypothetical protein
LRDLAKFVKNKFNHPLVIAEIGVERGCNALDMLNEMNIKQLYLVDHYSPYGDCLTSGGCPQDVQDMVYRDMFKRLQDYMNKTIFVTKDSVFASSLFPDEFFDFIYIDGSHDYEPVKQDVISWWSKVKVGGVIGGHDYKNSPYVEQLVKEFATEKQLQILEFLDDIRNAEWGIIK